MNLTLLCVLYNYTNKLPSSIFIVYLLALVCFDIYSIFNLNIIYYLSSQSIIFISLLIYYFPLLPKFIQTSIYQIVFLVLSIIVLFLNETYNCQKMLKINPQFPYHVFIEITGIALFYVICKNFSKLT